MAKIKKQFVTPNEFAAVINGIKGCQFASIAYTNDTASIDKKLVGGKKNPYNGQLKSVTTMSGIQIGASYENAVNNRTESKDFVASRLPWGEWLRPNYLISHKGNIYLRAYKTKASKTEVTYYQNGEVVSDKKTLTDILSNIRKSGESKKQSEMGIDEQDQVKPFTTNIANIESAVINGVTYIITKI